MGKFHKAHECYVAESDIERILDGLCPVCLLSEGFGEDRPDEEPLREVGSASSIYNVTAEDPYRYVLSDELARGGMGRIVLAYDEHLGRDIVVKELVPHDGARDHERLGKISRRRFLREARITGKLDHPSIVHIHELGCRADGSLYYTMPWVRGQTLAQAIAACASFSERLALLPHFLDLCNAIAFAHSQGVVHRDIKPENVMVGPFGETVVIDWGLAKELTDEEAWGNGEGVGSSRDSRLYDATLHGDILGTPAYMAPEQARGQGSEVSQAADIYSLGAVLYEILTAHPPFEADTASQVIEQVIAKPPTPIESREKNVPAELQTICRKALAKNPADRFSSAQTLAEEVQDFQTGGLVGSHEYGFLDYFRRFYKRHRATANVVLAAMLVLLVGLGFYIRDRSVALEKERTLLTETQASNESLRAEVYVASMNAAQKATERGVWSRAQDFLDRCPEEYRGWEWDYLQRVVRPYAYEVPNEPENGIGGYGWRALLSEDDRFVLDAWNFSSVFSVYDIENKKRVFIAAEERFTGWYGCLGFGLQPGTITVGIDNQTAGYFDYVRNTILRTFSIDEGWLWAFRISGDGRYAAGLQLIEGTGERTIFVWDFQSGELLRTIPLKSDDPKFFAQMPVSERHWRLASHNQHMVIGSFLSGNRHIAFVDGDLGTANVETGEILRIAPAGHGRFDIDTHSNSGAIAVSSTQVNIYSLLDGELKKELKGVFDTPRQMSFGMKGALLGIECNTTGQFGVWDTQTGKELARYRANDEHIYDLSLSQNKPMAVTSGTRGGIRLFDLSATMPVEEFAYTNAEGDAIQLPLFEPWRAPIFPHTFDDARSLFAWSTYDNEFSIWSVPEYHHVRTFSKGHEGMVTDLDFNPDGSLVAASSWKGDATVWNVQTGEVVAEFTDVVDEACTAVAFSPDGKTLLIGYGERTPKHRSQHPPRLYDVETWEPMATLDQIPGRANDFIYSPDGKYLFVGGFAGNNIEEPSFRIYDVDDNYREVGGINGIGWGSDIQFLPDGRHLLALGDLRELVLFDMQTMTQRYRIRDLNLSLVAVHPGGTRFATANHRANIIYIHNVSDGRVLLSLPDAQGPMYFSEDGTSLHCRTVDGSLRVYHSQN